MRPQQVTVLGSTDGTVWRPISAMRIPVGESGPVTVNMLDTAPAVTQFCIEMSGCYGTSPSDRCVCVVVCVCVCARERESVCV
jgi:hypothetical protein